MVRGSPCRFVRKLPAVHQCGAARRFQVPIAAVHTAESTQFSLSLSLSSLDECYSAWPRIGCRPRRRSRRVGDERPIPEHGPDNPVTFRDVSHQSVEAHESQSALSSFADQRTATSCHAVSSVYRIKPWFHVKIKLS